MKQFIVNRHTDPNNPVMEQVPTEKIPIYQSKEDAESDLTNLPDGQLVGITEGNGDGSAAGVPVGSVIAMYSSRAPSSAWLLCDGSTFDENKYPALYLYLGSNKLPDLRECVIVGAGQSDNDYDENDNPTGIHDHDVYALGQFKDDQLQDHKHKSGNYGGGDYDYSGPTRHDQNNSYETTGVSTGRYGTTTHGKQFGLNYFIKAVTSSSDSDYQETLQRIVEAARSFGSPLGSWQSFEGDQAPNSSWLMAGTTFDADSYPALAMLLGTNKVPDKFDHSRLGAEEVVEIKYLDNSSSNISSVVPTEFTKINYDGVLQINTRFSGNNGLMGCYKKDFGYVAFTNLYGGAGSPEYLTATVDVKKDDEICLVFNARRTDITPYTFLGSPFIVARYYKHPMFIKAIPNTDDSDFQSTLNTIRGLVDNTDYKVKASASYSTEETLTGGTWIDGKPIYRRTFEVYKNNVLNGWTRSGRYFIYQGNDLSIDELISNSAITSNSILTNWVSGTDGTDYPYGIRHFISDSKHAWDMINANSAQFSGTKCILTIEYTKTTD